MPVRRFRSIEEMKQPRWRVPGDPDLLRAIAALWALGDRTGRHRFPPGVYRHRSVEDMDRQTRTWQEANFRAWRERLDAQAK